MPAARSPRRRGSPGRRLLGLSCEASSLRPPGLVVSNPLCRRRLPVRSGVLLKAEEQRVGAPSLLRLGVRVQLTRAPNSAQIGEGAWRAFKANSIELELLLKKRSWVQRESAGKDNMKVRVPRNTAFQAVTAGIQAVLCLRCLFQVDLCCVLVTMFRPASIH